MPNLNVRRFSRPEVLKSLRMESLLRWLEPAREYLVSRGIEMAEWHEETERTSETAGNGQGEHRTLNIQHRRSNEGNGAESRREVDYDALAAAFVDPQPDMPEYLVDSLDIINEMADERGMDAILEGAEKRGITLALPDECTPADVALEAWLQARELLEEIHLEHQLTRPRSFVTFGCAEEIVPAFEVPTQIQVTGLEDRLDDFYARKQRGRSCRVWAFPNGKQCRFLVRHGEPCKREGAIKDGESTSVFYRPEKYDVVTYDMERGELRIHCSGSRELQELRKAFGAHLFGQEEFFPETGKYTLTPLAAGPECLVCRDIDGIESVVLVELEISYRGSPSHRIKHTSEDIYALVEQEKFRWPAVPERITRATFDVRFVAGKKSRRVTIVTPNRALYGRDDDSVLIERWLMARGFIIEEVTDEVSGRDLVSA